MNEILEKLLEALRRQQWAIETLNDNAGGLHEYGRAPGPANADLKAAKKALDEAQWLIEELPK